jgi:hypothetical protein
MYVSSQRGINNEGIGVTYEIAGPFAGGSVVDTGGQHGLLQPAVRLGPS